MVGKGRKKSKIFLLTHGAENVRVIRIYWRDSKCERLNLKIHVITIILYPWEFQVESEYSSC